MIKTTTARHLRQTTAEWSYEENGEPKTATIIVKYFARSIKEVRDTQKILEQKLKDDPNFLVFHSDYLAERVAALPDLVGEDGKNVPITAEWFETQDMFNLHSLRDAIEADSVPKSNQASVA